MYVLVMAKENPQEDLLPEFEAVLKSAEFLDLDKEKINKLADEKLRSVNELVSLQKLNVLYSDNKARIFLYQLQNKGLKKFENWIKKNKESETTINGYTANKADNITSKLKPTLFDLQNIALTGTDILLISDEKNDYGKKPVVFITNADTFLNDGVGALEWYTGDLDKLPRNSIWGKNSIEVKLGDYKLQHIGGETLKISKSGCVDNTMDGHSFDILPKQSKKVEKDVIVNFKSDYLEFFSLKQVSENDTNQIRAEKYQHRGVDYIDYDRYGRCIQGILDPNKNFSICIFESGGKRSLKILRLDASAELMESFDNINEFVGFDNDMDIIAYDHEGKLRKIDANFNNFPMYTEAKLAGIRSETSAELNEVIGDCVKYPDMFASEKFTKAVAIVLEQNNLVSKNEIMEILTRISEGEFITRSERDNLGFLLHPDNPTLLQAGDAFIDKLKVHKPMGSKREAPLNNLILKEGSDDPDTKKILAEYSAYLASYPNVTVADKVIKVGPFVHLIQNNRHTLKIKKGNEYVSILDNVDTLTIEGGQATTSSLVTYTKDNMRGTLTISLQGDITNKVIRADIYLNEPTFDVQGIGVVQHKANKKRGFATLIDNVIHDLGTEQYDTLKALDGGFYLATEDKKSYLCIPSSKNNAVSSQEVQKVFDDRIYVQNEVSAVLVTMLSGEEKIVTQCDGVLHKGMLVEGLTSSDKQTKEEFKNTGSVIRILDATNKGEKSKNKKEPTTGQIIYQVLPDGGITQTAIFKEIWFMQAGKFCVGVDTTEKLVNYELTTKGWENRIDDITYLGTQKISGGQLAASREYYIGQKASKEIVGYRYMTGDAKLTSLSPQELAEWLGITPGTVIGSYSLEKREYFFVRGTKDEILQVPYIGLSKPNIYQSVPYHRFKSETGKYGIGRVVNNKREEFLAPTSSSEPNFQKESFTFGNNTYNLNSKGEFIKLEHDFDTLIGLDQPGWYCVAKGTKYGIAHMVDGKIQLTGNLEYDASPYIKENRCVIKKGATYELRDISAGRAEKKSYPTTYEPIMTHIKRGYVVFDVPQEGLALVPLADVQAHKTLKANQCYEEIVKSTRVSGMNESEYFKMKKKNGGYDFLIDGQFLSTVSSSSDLFEIQCVQKINDTQRIIIGGPSNKVGLYFNNQGSISKLSSKCYDNWNDYGIKSIKLGDIDWDQYLYGLKETGYGDENEVEYILLRKLPHDKLTTVRTPKPKKTPYTVADFEIVNNTLFYAGENGSKFKKLFVMQSKLASEADGEITDLKNIATFGIGSETEVEEDDLTKI